MTSADENRADEPEIEAASATEAPPTATELLRTALVNDDDPRFPWWLPLPGLTLALTWAGYSAATTTATAAAVGGAASPLAELVATLLWPGAAIFVLTTGATWFGWQLEID